VAVAPLGLALPFMVAVDEVTSVAALVVTVGTARVVNDSTAPNDRPSPLEAIAQK
jgi:hypothetical protein